MPDIHFDRMAFIELQTSDQAEAVKNWFDNK